MSSTRDSTGIGVDLTGDGRQRESAAPRCSRAVSAADRTGECGSPSWTSSTSSTRRRRFRRSGGFAFDNLFLINGVDVSDNLFGIPFNLFIEDAIEQTQIMTSGIGAECGRFTGGVVNAVTRNGGNTLAGSWRTNASNPSWSAATPLERCADPGRIVPVTCRPAAPRSGRIELSHEATLGGPIVADRAWFFGAVQLSEVSTSSSLPQTNLQNTQTDSNRRGEVKITGTLSNHTIRSGYANNSTRQRSRPTLSYSIDRFAAADRTLPNWYLYGNYRGVIRKNLFVPAPPAPPAPPA